MVRIDNVNFGYRKNRDILSDVSLSLDGGHVHGLLGCNGAGKTTLMKIMSGLLIPRKGGGVAVDDHIPAQRKPSFLREMIFIPEEFDMPHVLFDDFVKVNSAFYPAFSNEHLDRYASEFGVDRRAHLDSMSMGERKKSYIAFALACQPAYLFMDEPTNGLDIPSKSMFKSILASFADPGKTVVISTHQVADVQNLIDNVVIMDKEGIVFNKSTEEISRALTFGPLDKDQEAIWSRDGLSGRVGVTLNKEGRYTAPDLDMLFNAVVMNKELMTSIFKQ